MLVGYALNWEQNLAALPARLYLGHHAFTEGLLNYLLTHCCYMRQLSLLPPLLK